ncbi:MGT family Glycosyltransferase [Phlyctema vagabunda]|uniref:MGT family Glycosyltransferase n=1 Tax=Phlyctema vagabunda TaxID=108571 RepID=A0ABR4P553_9HELO
MTVSIKPVIVICVTPIYGHLMPICEIARALLSREYDVVFCTGSAYRYMIEDIGASFVPLEGYCDFTEEDFETRWPERNQIPPGLTQLVYDMEQVFVASMASQWESQQTALKQATDTYPGRQILLLTEGAFLGSLPTLLGAPGIQPSASITIGIVPVVLSSIDLPPFGPGLPPDATPEGRERNVAMNKQFVEQVMASPMKRFHETLASLGADKTDSFFFDAMYRLPDRFLQMCPPSVEYPRSDAPKSLRFAGGIPRSSITVAKSHPSWWSDITNKAENQKIVFASQGTVAMNVDDLIVPTMTALKDRTDVLVVVALGKKGSSLPSHVSIPDNARVADFIPFDDILQYADVYVTNGGYGGFQHGIHNATPMVMAGATEDKPEVSARAEWCGAAKNLRTGSPSPEAIREAVLDLFADPTSRKKCLELQAEMHSYDPISVLVENIKELL